MEVFVKLEGKFRMRGIISVFGITNGIGHTLSSFSAFSVSTPVSTMDVM